MSQAKSGDKVKIHYTGKLENGNIFDSTREGPPLELVIGSRTVFPELEDNIIGMTAGESRNITLQPEQAFGPKRVELIVQIDSGILPAEITPEIGMQLQNKQPDGKLINVIITDIKDNAITLDANHPLAGQAVILDIELVEIG